MPLQSIPVVIPWQLEGDDAAVTHATGVQTVATTPQAALAVGQVLVKALVQMRYPGRGARILTDRTRAGEPGGEVQGPYLYALTMGNHIAHIALAPRLDQDNGQRFEDAMAGFDPQTTLGVIMDCVHLTYINSKGLAVLAGSTRRLNLHLFRVPAPILKVLEMTGLDRLIPHHFDLQTALGAMVKASLEARSAGKR